ncbi:MAG: hypothetical protein U0043_00280 [Streptococcus sp.]
MHLSQPSRNPQGQDLVEYVSNDVVVFGNDRNDIELFKESLYAVQVGDFSVLTEFADEQIGWSVTTSQPLQQDFGSLCPF